MILIACIVESGISRKRRQNISEKKKKARIGEQIARQTEQNTRRADVSLRNVI